MFGKIFSMNWVRPNTLFYKDNVYKQIKDEIR